MANCLHCLLGFISALSLVSASVITKSISFPSFNFSSLLKGTILIWKIYGFALVSVNSFKKETWNTCSHFDIVIRQVSRMELWFYLQLREGCFNFLKREIQFLVKLDSLNGNHSSVVAVKKVLSVASRVTKRVTKNPTLLSLDLGSRNHHLVGQFVQRPTIPCFSRCHSFLFCCRGGVLGQCAPRHDLPQLILKIKILSENTFQIHETFSAIRGLSRCKKQISLEKYNTPIQ